MRHCGRIWFWKIHSERGKKAHCPVYLKPLPCVIFVFEHNDHTFWTAQKEQKLWGWHWEGLLSPGIVSNWTAGKWFQKAKVFTLSAGGGDKFSAAFVFVRMCGKERSNNYLNLWVICHSDPNKMGWLGKIWFFSFWFNHLVSIFDVSECGQVLSLSCVCTHCLVI